ncbi:MAG: hypothetical protein ACOZQL_08300 [Myxococcota bacterium]
MRRRLLALGVVLASLAHAQQAVCETNCNAHASECMKGCVSDPKDIKTPEHAKRVMTCMRGCEDENRQCKSRCEAVRPRDPRR